MKAINDNKVESVKGILSRFPKLASSERLAYVHTETTDEIRTIIQQVKGMSPLESELRKDKPNWKRVKQLIFQYPHQLNQEYDAGVTALTLCKKSDVRKLMVQLGANPRYLATDVSTSERDLLHCIYIVHDHLIIRKRFSTERAQESLLRKF